MESVGFLLKLSTCILIFLILENFCVTCNNPWCYDQPGCGPSTWGSIGSCNGRRQSPINIDTRSVKPSPRFEVLQFKHYEKRNLPKLISNTGYHCQINFWAKATISGGGLSATYTLQQAHFHWGTDKTNGAEHTVDGKRFTMEMHLVHTKHNMSVEDASKLRDGIVVATFFLEKSEKNEQDASWNTLAKFFKNIPEKGNSYALNGEFSLGALLSRADLNRYYSYRGSLTSPPCSESVLWIVFTSSIQIHTSVVSTMVTSLFFTTAQENRRMQNNFRPTQALNGRTVYYYTEYRYKSLISCFSYCATRMF